MFKNCSSLTEIALRATGTPETRHMYQAFMGCANLKSADFTSFDMSHVDTIESLFGGCKSLVDFRFPEEPSTKLTQASNAFAGCSSLVEADLSRFDMSQVRSMSFMFNGCKALKTLKFPASSKIKVAGAMEMLRGCSSLTELDLTSFEPTVDANLIGMFIDCGALRKVVLGDRFMFKGAWLPTGNVDLGGTSRKLNWIRVDESGDPIGEPMSVQYIQTEYKDNPAPEGTYVWNTHAVVDFNVNGGSGSMERAYLDLEKTGSLTLDKASGLTRPNFAFAGWNTKANGSGTPFADGAKIFSDELIKMVDKDLRVTLYAQWSYDPTVKPDPDTGAFEFSMPAGFEAHITGIPSGTTYRVYEKTPAGWQLVDVQNNNGVIEAAQKATATFVNEFAPGKTSARIVATKQLDGAWAQPESGFTFNLTEVVKNADGGTTEKVVQENVAVTEGGTISFEPIEYTEAGTHTYKITENLPASAGGIEYDKSSEIVTVTVSSKDGKLSAAVAYDDADKDPGVAAFHNTTLPGSLSITKNVAGASDATAQAEFSFMLTLDGVPYAGPYTVGDASHNTTDGVVKLKGGQTATVSGMPVGATYAVSETAIPSGWSLTNSAGTSGVIAPGATSQASFTNTYAATGSAQLVAYKKMDHGFIADGAFSFDLYAQGKDGELTEIATAMNGPVDTAQTLPGEGGQDVDNPVYGMAPVYFPAQSFSAPGTYTYVMREVVPANAVNADGVTYAEATTEQKAAGGFALDGIVYDSADKTATVKVSDNGNGKLSTSVTYEAGDKIANKGNLFTNVLQEHNLIVDKVVPKDELTDVNKNTKFTFELELTDANGAPLKDLAYEIQAVDGKQAADKAAAPQTGKVSDGGTITLGANERAVIKGLPYGSTYVVTEQPAGGWSQVAEQTTGTEGTISGADAHAVITNVYDARGSVTLKANKKLNGGELKDKQFTFVLRDMTEGSDGFGTVIQEVGNTKDGKIAFAPLEFTEADHGKIFTYEISELAQAADGDYVFDDAVVKATVKVTDAGNGKLGFDVKYDGKSEEHTFENWVAVVLARTGGPGVGLAGVALMAAGCVWFLRRRKRSNA
ncbi:MAG: FctA domain-containing protein [Coriobacteriaceae bacterium]|nr:FctA domain-containing protein [Coriobacteriaceae bacterium]